LQNLYLATSYLFHLIATVIWLGGLAILTLMVWPEANRTLHKNAEFYAFMNRLRKRFVPLSNASLAILLGTGMLQMSLDENYLGVLDFGNQWSVAMLLKHIAFVGMVVCSLTIQYGIAPSLERTTLLIAREKATEADIEPLRKREIRLTWLNNGMGVLVLAFTAWATAI
jgi:uncharacterized membrane protein